MFFEAKDHFILHFKVMIVVVLSALYNYETIDTVLFAKI